MVQDTEVVEFIAAGIEAAACFSTHVMWGNEPPCGGCGSCEVCDTTYLDLRVEFSYEGRKAVFEAARAALVAILEEAGVDSLEELREDMEDSGEVLATDFWHDFGMCLWYTKEGHGCGFFDDPSRWDAVGGEDVCRNVGKQLSVRRDGQLWPAVKALGDGDYEVMDLPEAGE